MILPQKDVSLDLGQLDEGQRDFDRASLSLGHCQLLTVHRLSLI